MHWTQTARGRKIMAKNARRKKGLARTVSTESAAPKGKAFARAEINELAAAGAQARLAELERECEKLRMFLHVQGRTE